MIKYTTTYFTEPDPISYESYESIKKKLDKYPYENIIDNQTFNSKFRRYYILILVGTIAGILSFLLEKLFSNKIETLTTIVNFIAFFCFFGGMIYLFLEGSSYSKYLAKSDAYFLRMKFAILKSESFEDFNKIFYSIFSFDYNSEYKFWRKKYFKELKAEIKNHKLFKKSDVAV